MRLLRVSGAAVAASFLLAGTALAEPQVEVLHWWTSGGEAAAVRTLMDEFQANGGTWVDMPVAGGAGDAAMTALRARVLSGNPPTAVQLKGPAIQEWYEEGALSDISAVAEAENWAAALPEAVSRHMKCEDTWCAAPVNIHRVDWIWANPAVLKEAGVEAESFSTWDEFNQALEKVKAAGKVALAHGGQPWQDATIFETVVLGLGGPEFYQRALVDLDEEALGSDTMKQVFDQMRTLRGYVDPNYPGRDWNLATAMVINGEAAFQIMGDWAKGEFTAAGKQAGADYLCVSTPGDGYLYNVDSFAMFNVSGDERVQGQELLSKLIMGPNFQKTFNLAKGSIPARVDIPMDDFDACAKASHADLVKAQDGNNLLPSYAHGMALRSAEAGAITDVVTAHFNSDMSSDEAVQRLVDAVRNAQQ